MYYHSFQIVFQEVPGEISLCFSICGCTLRCDGCHSPFLWKEGNGRLFENDRYLAFLEEYKDYATCVLFMGGEWHEKELIEKLKLAKSSGFKTCLYTGEENVSKEILSELTWIKTGSWKEELGGLESPITNQKFTEVNTNKNLNHLFQKPQK